MKTLKANEHRPKLSNFVLGDTILLRNEGLRPKEVRTTMGYLIPAEEDGKEYVYDLISRNVYELYNSQSEVGLECFRITNIPWENSDGVVDNGIDEIISILGKYIEEYKEDRNKVKHTPKVKRKKISMSYYE